MKFKDSLSKFGFWVKRNGPDILFISGLTVMTASSVYGCIQAVKMEKEIDKIKDEHIVKIANAYSEMDHYTHEAYVKEIKKETKSKLVKSAVKKMAIPVIGYALGTAAVCSSHAELKNRLSVVSSSLASVTAAYAAYKADVKKKIGEEEEKEIAYKKNEVNKETGELIEKGENLVFTLDDAKALYSENTTHFWSDRMYENVEFLKVRQNFLTEKLKSRGHLFLNEVFDELDLPRTEAGQFLGWIYDPSDKNRDCFVDYGTYIDNASEGEKFILLEFNIDGNIMLQNFTKKK